MHWDIILWVVIVGLIFDYTNGFHDAANVVSTIIATKVLVPLKAILLAVILNTLGATQISGVAQTIATGLVQAGAATQVLVLAALIGAIVWNTATWFARMPSSSSYALIGGLIGAALVSGGSKVVLWNGLFVKVIIPMILSPILGLLLGFLVMKGLVFLLKFPRIRAHEKIFNRLQIASASLVALSHGLNDAQKSMGIITLGLFAGGYLSNTQIPLWVILACALMMGVGTASGGFRIIRTVGYEITHLKPFQGFAAETSASAVILTASFLGMPISSTHMIVGSVTGVGSARGAKHVHWETARRVMYTWALTLPGSALVAAGAYRLFNVFGLF